MVIKQSRRLATCVAVAGVLAATTTTVDSWSQMNDATKTCVDAYGNAQEYRKNGDLLKAREALWTCAAATCPGIIQNDCTTWLGQVVESIPSVVLEAKVGDDSVFDVAVSMDGKRVATQLDGKPIEINPGLHTFVFERQGADAVEKKVIVAAHSKSQVVLASWSPPVATPSTVAVSGPVSTRGANTPAVEMTRPVPVLTYALGGVAVAGIATFAVLGLTGYSSQHNLESTCSPYCSSSQVNSLEGRFIGADVALGVGVLAAAGAVVSFVLRPERPVHAEATTAGQTVTVAPVSGGAAVQWRGAF